MLRGALKVYWERDAESLQLPLQAAQRPWQLSASAAGAESGMVQPQPALRAKRKLPASEGLQQQPAGRQLRGRCFSTELQPISEEALPVSDLPDDAILSSEQVSRWRVQLP